MLTKKSVAFATCIKNKIFCCGDKPDDPIECCCSRSKKWRYVPEFNSIDQKSAVQQLVTHRERLHIVRHGLIEEYEFDTNTYRVVS